MAPKKKRGSSKQEEKANQQFEKQVAEFVNLLHYLQEKPSLYCRKELEFLREFVDYAEDHRDQFPRRRSIVSVDSSTPVPPNPTPVLPTKGFVLSLANHTFENDSTSRPIVQILDIETSYKDGPPGHERVKKTVSSIIDGDGNRMCCHFAVHLTEVSRSLSSGSLIRLNVFSDSCYKETDASPLMPVILVLWYEALGSTDLVVGRNDIETPESEPFQTPSDENEPQSVTTPVPTDDENIEPIPDRGLVCTAKDHYCSHFNVYKKVCVCETDPLVNFDLKVIAENCYFVDRPVEEMKPWHKRNLLYWWYATDIYNLCGKYNRGKLPRCLVRMIRMAHPNPRGTPYKDFVELEEDERPSKKRRCDKGN